MRKTLTELLNSGKVPPRNWVPSTSHAKAFALTSYNFYASHGLLDTVLDLDKWMENPEEDWVECHLPRGVLDYAGRLLDYIIEHVQKSGESTCVKFFAEGNHLTGYLLIVHDGSDEPVKFRGAIPTPYRSQTGKLYSICPVRSEEDKLIDYRGRLNRLYNRLESVEEVVQFNADQRLSLRIKPLKKAKCAV